MPDLIFYIFAGLALASASMVILVRNPVRAVLSLILTFVATAATWLMLDAEFLAITLVLVYVGAVMVLFLFVIMMLEINMATLKASFTKWLPIGIGLAIALFILLMAIIERDALVGGPSMINNTVITSASNVAMLGEIIFTKYLLQFEIAGIILLVAIIAAIGLVYRGPRDRKLQNIASQLAVTPAQRLRLVDGD